MRYLKQNTAVTIVIGSLVDWADGKTLLRDNEDWVPADITCELIKGSSSSTVTLTQTGGSNDCNLTGKGQATLELTASDTDTAGQLRLSFANKITDDYSSNVILPFVEDFMVLPANVYDSLVVDSDKLQVDSVQIEGSDATDQVNAACDAALTDYDGPTNAEVTSLHGTTDGLLNTIAGYLDTEIAAILEDTGTTLPAQIAALNNVSAANVVTALLGDTTITAGGNWSLRKLLKVLIAWSVGLVRDKSGESGTSEILDPDDGTTVIAELLLSETSPYRTINVL